MQHTNGTALNKQGNSHQRFDAFLAQQRVENICLADIVDYDRFAFRDDLAGKTLSDWYAHAQVDFFFQPLSGPGDELVSFCSQQQDGNCIDIQNLANPCERFRKHFIQR